MNYFQSALRLNQTYNCPPSVCCCCALNKSLRTLTRDTMGSAGSLYEVPLWSSLTDSWRWPSRTPPPLYRSVWPPPGSWKGRTGFCCQPPAVSGPTAPGWTCCLEEMDIWWNSCKLPSFRGCTNKCLAVSVPKSCRFDTDTETPPWNPWHMFVSWTRRTSLQAIWAQDLSLT